MANIQNLKPFQKGQVSKEMAVKNGRKGGYAAAKANRARKNAYEIVKMYLNEATEVKGKKMDRRTLILTNACIRTSNALMSSSNKPMSNDELKSLDYILQLAGEAPIPKTQQEVTVSAPIQIIDDVDKDTKPEGTE